MTDNASNRNVVTTAFTRLKAWWAFFWAPSVPKPVDEIGNQYDQKGFCCRHIQQAYKERMRLMMDPTIKKVQVGSIGKDVVLMVFDQHGTYFKSVKCNGSQAAL